MPASKTPYPPAVLYACIRGEAKEAELSRFVRLTHTQLHLTVKASFCDPHDARMEPLQARSTWWRVERALTKGVAGHLVVPSLNGVAHSCIGQRALYRWVTKVGGELHYIEPDEHAFTHEDLASGALDVLVLLERAHRAATRYTLEATLNELIHELKPRLEGRMELACKRRDGMIQGLHRKQHADLNRHINRAQTLLSRRDIKDPKQHMRNLAATLRLLLPAETVQGWNDPWAQDPREQP